MKRFTMDEIIARRKEKTTKSNGNVGNLSETCRKLVGNLSETCRKQNCPTDNGLYVKSSKRIPIPPQKLCQFP